MCGTCHSDRCITYKYGGSPYEVPKTSPTNGFTHYNDIIDGYGFTKEYNEEGGNTGTGVPLGYETFGLSIDFDRGEHHGENRCCKQAVSRNLAGDEGDPGLPGHHTLGAIHQIRGDTPLKDAAVLMAQQKISGVPVLDEAGRVAGVISEQVFLSWIGAPDTAPGPEEFSKPE